MDIGKALIIVAITLIVVIGFNFIIYLGSRGDRTIRQVELFKRATKMIRNPWQVEDSMLNELSEATNKIRDKSADQKEETE